MSWTSQVNLVRGSVYSVIIQEIDDTTGEVIRTFSARFNAEREDWRLELSQRFERWKAASDNERTALSSLNAEVERMLMDLSLE